MQVPSSISYLIWIAGPAANLLALALLFRRRVVREFPVFSSYLVFHLIETVVGFLVYQHFGRKSWEYLYEYWTVQALGLGLRFGVIYEIFSHVFRPYEGLRRAGTLGMRWAAMVLVLLAVLVALAGPAEEPTFAVSGAVVIGRSIDVVQCGLLVLLFLCASYFALTWRNYVFGIALGFGLIATAELLTAALATQFASYSDVLLNSVPRVAYDLAGIVWIVYLASPEPARVELKALPQHDLEKWNQELLELLQR
jgi:hypothetical protein